MNGPSVVWRPSARDSVAGTLPPALVCGTTQPPQAIESRPLIDAPLFVIAPVAVLIVTRVVAPPKAFTTPYSVRPSHAKSALEIMPFLFGEFVRRVPGNCRKRVQGGVSM